MKALPLEFRLGWGHRLKEAMRAAGYNVARLADALGTSENNVYRWASGQLPELPEIQRVASQLKVSPGWLLFGEGKDHHPLVAWLAGLLAGWSLLAAPVSAGELPSGGMRNTARQIENLADELPLIGRWLCAWLRGFGVGPVLAHA